MRPILIRSLAVALVAITALTGCGNDSTSPQDDGPPAFGERIGCRPDLNTTADDVVVMSDGSRVVVGTFSGILHITGSPDSLSAGGTSRVYLAAFNPDGSLKGLTSAAGGPAPDIAHATRDAGDNLLLVGSYSADIFFGGTSLSNGGGTDIFFAKLDKEAQAIWVFGASSTAGDAGRDIAAANDGSVYICGSSGDEMQVAGEDVGVPGKSTGFLVKLSDTGSGHWSQTAATTGVSNCHGVAVSADGTVVVCGTYAGSTVEFSGDVLPNDGATDSFIGRFAADGSNMGAIHLGGTGTTAVRAITTQGNDAIVTGYFNGTVDFDVNTPAGNVTASGADAFVARYNQAGALLWVKTFGAGDDQVGLRIARMSGSRILLCGTFGTSISIGSKTLTAAGASDVFIARLDGDGKVLTASDLGGADTEDAVSGTADGTTAIVAGTTFSDPMIFPNGTHLGRFGKIDGYLYQQP